MDGTWEQFKIDLEVALRLLFSGDATAYEALWSRGPAVSMLAASGECWRGWEQIESRLDLAASRYTSGALEAHAVIVEWVSPEVIG